MATTPRGGKAFVWVTWITGLLAGEKECLFAPWFRSHFRYEKVQERDFNLAAWNADHAAMVQARRDTLVHEGWTVSLESANQFRLYGQTAVLSGKPDLVARKPGEVLVVDCKTGQQRHADWWQVLVYLLALPRCVDDCKGVTLRGEVCYKDHAIAIEPEELNAQRRDQIYAVLKQLGAAERLPKQPSERECTFCDIGPGDCSERWTAPAEVDLVTAEEF